MMTPAELTQATLAKRVIFVIRDGEIEPVKIAACSASAKPSFLIILVDGTNTTPFETEFYMFRSEAKRALLKAVKKVEAELVARLN